MPRLPFGRFEAPPALNSLMGVLRLLTVFHPKRTPARLEDRLRWSHAAFNRHAPSRTRVDALVAETRPLG